MSHLLDRSKAGYRSSRDPLFGGRRHAGHTQWTDCLQWTGTNVSTEQIVYRLERTVLSCRRFAYLQSGQLTMPTKTKLYLGVNISEPSKSDCQPVVLALECMLVFFVCTCTMPCCCCVFLFFFLLNLLLSYDSC